MEIVNLKTSHIHDGIVQTKMRMCDQRKLPVLQKPSLGSWALPRAADGTPSSNQLSHALMIPP